jgi:hypothetical protein
MLAGRKFGLAGGRGKKREWVRTRRENKFFLVVRKET